MKKYRFALAALLFLVVFMLFSQYAEAQCPMCRMSAESNLKNGGTEGRGSTPASYIFWPCHI